MEPAFSPNWTLGQRWKAFMRTQAYSTADMAPEFTRRVFSFEVTRTPKESPEYRVELRPDDDPDEPRYAMYFRKDFSLARLARQAPGGGEATIVSNGDTPYLGYDRHLAVIADFPLPGASADAKSTYTLGGKTVIQKGERTSHGWRFVIESTDPSGTIRATIDWEGGAPWWSNIVCQEIAPDGGEETVASGGLIPDQKRGGQ